MSRESSGSRPRVSRKFGVALPLGEKGGAVLVNAAIGVQSLPVRRPVPPHVSRTPVTKAWNGYRSIVSPFVQGDLL